MALFSSVSSRDEVLHGCMTCTEADQTSWGLGLRAARAFARGDVVYRERPAVFMQSGWSSRVAPACLNCGMLTGGRLCVLLQQTRTACGQEQVPEAASAPLLEQSGLLEDERFSLPAPVPCESAGCTAVFCSNTCREAQLSRGHHRVICATVTPEQRSAWIEFCLHADTHHDTFKLAGLVVAQAICDVEAGDASVPEALARYTGYTTKPWPELVVEHARDRSSWVERRWDILRTSHSLLTEVILRAPEGLGELLSVEGYAKLVGMLDLVAKDLERPNPVDVRLKSVLEDLPAQLRTELSKFSIAWMRARTAAHEAAEQTSPESSDEEGEEEEPGTSEPKVIDLVSLSKKAAALPVLPGFEGFGLVRAVALTNHSCESNLDVVPSVYNADVVALACRDVSAGEELFMGYIDDDDSRSVRQRTLLSRYNFECQCTRCEAEKAIESKG